MGHIKSRCPPLSKLYPFDNSHNVVDSGVLLPMGSRSERVEEDPCSSVEVVAKSKPADNVERETCQGTGITEADPGFKASAVNMSKPESVERETCQGVGKGTLLINDQSESPNTVNQVSKDINAETAEARRLYVSITRTSHCQGSGKGKS